MNEKPSKHKCPIHNTWMRTDKYHKELGARCEVCLVAADKKRKEIEKQYGFNHPPIKIGKI